MSAASALHTPLCDRFGIEVPIVQASLGAASSPALTAAASNNGALGTLGVAILAPEETRRRVAELRELTDQPFTLNTTYRPFREEVYAEMLAAKPTVVSISLGLSQQIVDQAHDAGVLFVIQVDSVQHAEEAAELGVDAIIAQGGEAGGLGGDVSTLVLVPQVVDRVAPVPVIAAGGIADGRGIAAALTLGAQAVNVGTRFLATDECSIPHEFKRMLVEASSEDAVKAPFADQLMPFSADAWTGLTHRVLRNAWVDRWNAHPQEATERADELTAELYEGLHGGQIHEFLPFAGQDVGLVDSILPAGEVVHRLAAEADATLERLGAGAG